MTASDERFRLLRIDETLRSRTAKVVEGVGAAAAVALVLRPGECGTEALFMKRAEHPDDPWSGHVSLPGGRAEAFDQSLVHTAIRETSEELGLVLDPRHELVGPLDEVRATARAKVIDMKIAPFVFAVDAQPRPLVLNHEVASTHWISLVDLFDSARASSVAIERAGETYRFPAIAVHGLTIWGLTLRMLRNFETLTTVS